MTRPAAGNLLDTSLRAILWRQFGAAIDMLEQALRACPDELWRARLWGNETAAPELAEFWYVAYHTLFWLDLYLTGSVEGFSPPEPFGLEELDPAGLLPPRAFTREELLAYLAHCRQKCQATIAALSEAQAQQHCQFSWGEVSFLELLLDNMRHVQEHGAQLNMLLGQRVGATPRWVAKTKDPASGG